MSRSYHERRRRSIRLPGFDYANCGVYFITICTHRRIPVFGEVRCGRVHLTQTGQIAWDCWLALPGHFDGVTVDVFVIMPDHVHGILGAASGADVGATHASMVGDRRALEMVGAQHAAPLPCPTPAPNHPRGNGPYPGSLGTIIRSYKSAVTRHINLMRKTSGTHVWQRNYFERIIRTQPDLDCARWYIRTNPDRW
jgi:REP element-mobilizing transposase RayT